MSFVPPPGSLVPPVFVPPPGAWRRWSRSPVSTIVVFRIQVFSRVYLWVVVFRIHVWVVVFRIHVFVFKKCLE